MARSGFCRECGSEVNFKNKICPSCGVGWPLASNPLAVLSSAPNATDPRQTRDRVARRPSNDGVVPGIIGCIFAILGIFTLGIVFVPIAAVCSVIGVLLALAGRSGIGFGLSTIAAALTFAGAVVSPTVWALLVGLVVAR
jgi:hypothetical protein